MLHVAHPLVDGLSDQHAVRQWWEGRWPMATSDVGSPPRPVAAELDRLRNAQGTGKADRALLCSVIEAQYAQAGLRVPERCAALRQEQARTVTTGHQLCLAMGPAFTWYKVMTAITLAAQLERRWGTPVIPVFWMASEDHDFEEISGLWSGKAWHRWTPQEGQGVGGAVGRMSTEGLLEMLREWGEASGLQDASVHALVQASGGNLAQAMRRWMHQWFGADRLVVVDGDDPRLKAQFAGQLEKEWTEGVLFREVSRANAALELAGHKPQVHVRPVNLFHLSEASRTRVVPVGSGGWSAGAQSWDDAAAVQAHLARAPESVSPNALFRPLYQSWLLPDVAVVGGLAEVAYWLQLSTAYPAFEMVQPALVPRDSGWILSSENRQAMRSLGLSAHDLGQPLEAWEKAFIGRQNPPNAAVWRAALDNALEAVRSDFKAVDSSLEGSVYAARAKIEKLLEKLDQQGRRAVRRAHAENLERLRALHEACHPQGQAQERIANLNVLLAANGAPPFSGLSDLERGLVQGHGASDWTPKTHVWETPST